MFNNELPIISPPHEIQIAGGVETLEWYLHSHFKTQEQRREILTKRSREIIGLFKRSHSTLRLNIWMLLVHSQKMTSFFFPTPL
jgi:hypothetical protein